MGCFEFGNFKRKRSPENLINIYKSFINFNLFFYFFHSNEFL